MSNLAIYKEESQSLGEISFVKNIPSQVKIMEITNKNEFSKQLGLIMVKIINHLGIKNPVSDFEKADVKEMILMRFKHLSLDEVEYAFKLERYGVFGEKTNHYQLFNAEYVSNILNKYVKFRQKVRFDKNLVVKKMKTEEEVSDQEKLRREKQAVNRSLAYFEEYREVDTTRIYVYDILFALGKMPTDIAYKNRVKEDAVLLLEREQKQKKPTSIDEKREFAQVLKSIQKGTSPQIIIKCKELELAKFFRELKGKKLTEFKKEFEL